MLNNIDTIGSHNRRIWESNGKGKIFKKYDTVHCEIIWKNPSNIDTIHGDAIAIKNEKRVYHLWKDHFVKYFSSDTNKIKMPKYGGFYKITGRWVIDAPHQFEIHPVCKIDTVR